MWPGLRFLSYLRQSEDRSSSIILQACVSPYHDAGEVLSNESPMNVEKMQQGVSPQHDAREALSNVSPMGFERICPHADDKGRAMVKASAIVRDDSDCQGSLALSTCSNL